MLDVNVKTAPEGDVVQAGKLGVVEGAKPLPFRSGR
jgi:hypothetical protein